MTKESIWFTRGSKPTAQPIITPATATAHAGLESEPYSRSWVRVKGCPPFSNGLRARRMACAQLLSPYSDWLCERSGAEGCCWVVHLTTVSCWLCIQYCRLYKHTVIVARQQINPNHAMPECCVQTQETRVVGSSVACSSGTWLSCCVDGGAKCSYCLCSCSSVTVTGVLCSMSPAYAPSAVDDAHSMFALSNAGWGDSDMCCIRLTCDTNGAPCSLTGSRSFIHQ